MKSASISGDAAKVLGIEFDVKVEFIDYPKEVLLMEDVDRLVIIKNQSNGILAWVNPRERKCDDPIWFTLGGLRYAQVCETCGFGIAGKSRYSDEEKKMRCDARSVGDSKKLREIEFAHADQLIALNNALWTRIFEKSIEMGLQSLFIWGSGGGQKNILPKKEVTE